MDLNKYSLKVVFRGLVNCIKFRTLYFDKKTMQQALIDAGFADFTDEQFISVYDQLFADGIVQWRYGEERIVSIEKEDDLKEAFFSLPSDVRNHLMRLHTPTTREIGRDIEGRPFRK